MDPKDERTGPAGSGEDIDRLLDESLREVARPADVDLRARVMAAVDECEDRRREAPAGWFPAIAFGGALVLVLVTVLVLTHGRRTALRPAAGTQAANATTALRAEQDRRAAGTEERPASGQPDLSPSRESAAVPRAPRETAGSADGSHRAAVSRSVTPHRRKPAPGMSAQSSPIEPVDAWALSTGPYLPGAPAGELGDAIDPMPAPPPIAMAPLAPTPIESAPPVSDIARPVTDFPADTQPPESRSSASGPIGGTRR